MENPLGAQKAIRARELVAVVSPDRKPPLYGHVFQSSAEVERQWSALNSWAAENGRLLSTSQRAQSSRMQNPATAFGAEMEPCGRLMWWWNRPAASDDRASRAGDSSWKITLADSSGGAYRIAHRTRNPALNVSLRAPRDFRPHANPMLFLERQMNSLPTGPFDRSGDFGSV
jgi:hypothetical protein